MHFIDMNEVNILISLSTPLVFFYYSLVKNVAVMYRKATRWGGGMGSGVAGGQMRIMGRVYIV